MAVVNDYHCAVFFREIAYAFKVGDYTVHTEYAVGDDDFLLTAVRYCLFELFFKIFHIVVGVTITVSLGQTNAVDNARMVESVGNNCVVRRGNGFKQAAVSVETTAVKNSVFRRQELAESFFQFLMNRLCSANKTDAAHAVTVLVVAGFCRRDKFLIVGKTEIVVGAEVENAVSFGRIDLCALRSGDDALFFPQTGVFDFV